MKVDSTEAIEETINKLTDKYRIKRRDKFIFEKDNNIYFCEMLSNKEKIKASSEDLLESESIEVLKMTNVKLSNFKPIFDKVARKSPEIIGSSTTLMRSLPLIGSENIEVYPLNDQQFEVANIAANEMKKMQKNTKKEKIIVSLKNI
jgi:hypothetical protein